MRLKKYNNYTAYVSAQTAANKQKIQGVWADKKEIHLISDFTKKRLPNASFGICHGVRNGWEVTRFRKHLGFDIIGTEISDTANKFPHVIQWDFHEIKPEWFNATDFIYSNSLDHSYNPSYCLDQWMSCLKPDGLCFIQWSIYHDETNMSDSDCFGASLNEYKKMIENNYHIIDTIPVKMFKISRILKNLLLNYRLGYSQLKKDERKVIVISK